MPTVLTTLYCSEDDVVALASQEGVDLRLDDNEDDVVLPEELTRLTTQAVNYATSRVNDFAAGRYTHTDLGDNWTVNWWGTVIALRYLCARRFNAISKSVQELYAEVMDDLRNLKKGEYQLDLAERVASSPAYKNMRVVPWYRLRKIRQEVPISDGVPPRVPETRDRVADFIGPEF